MQATNNYRRSSTLSFPSIDSLLSKIKKTATGQLMGQFMHVTKDENGQKRLKTDLRYRKTKTVGSEYFYI
jgi:hypothetical protein